MKRVTKLWGLSLMNTVLAPFTLAAVASHVYARPPAKSSNFWIYLCIFTALFSAIVLALLLQIKFQWAWALAFFGHLTFCACIATVRKHVREKLDITGQVIEDFMVSLFLYPSVVLQLKMTLEERLQKRMCSKCLP